MRRILFAFTFSIALGAFAQASANYDGKWLVTWKTPRGAERVAYLDLTGTTGTFQSQGAGLSRDDPCGGKTFPTVVETATPEDLVVAINSSQTMRGCTDNRLTLKKSGDEKFEGAFAGGTKVTLTRR